ncbi:hypothetical protein FUAX_21190 [Fulvitalea axinellae]|uniref:Bacteroidetes PKD-like domain-containing protein n=1 Tax=Fulvitalea axinellae TaxID=1182444 RepID=A0AAU9CP17_9BACT|nr:hypothetical protein FUAX_21190 [Fulvitalea axinellae]
MNLRRTLTVLLGAAFLGACSSDSDDPVVPKLDIVWDIPSQGFNTKVNETLLLSPSVKNEGDAPVYQWIEKGVTVATTSTHIFQSSAPGEFTVKFKVQNGAQADSVKFNVTVTPGDNPAPDNAYLSEVFEYAPAPGQFVNTSLGEKDSGKDIIGKEGSLITLGGFGGYIIAGFDHDVSNGSEEDIIIYGNAFEGSSEPGIVFVMQDENGNGKPDDTWYEIKGEAHDDEGVHRDYEITYKRPASATADVPWTDNKGNSGAIKRNGYHEQEYFPKWIEDDSYTLRGTLLPARTKHDDTAGHIINPSYGKGYADNTSGGDRIDISNAIDAEGKAVTLSSIRFIKVQCAVNKDAGNLGEVSTEISGAADLSKF